MKVIFYIAAALLLFFIYIRYLEYKSLYYPIKKIELNPADEGLDFDEISLKTDDGFNLHGWFVPVESPRATVLFLHGNGGNIGHRVDKIKMLNGLNLNVLIVDYRGYGLSDGSPSEKNLYHDAEIMYRYLIEEKGISPVRIVANGESLGGAVAIELALKHEIGGLIIESSFTSVGDMAKTVFPFIPTFVYKSKYDSLDKISRVGCPMLFFHSPDDEIVPFKQGKSLFEAATGPKEFVEIGGGHNDGFFLSREIISSEIDLFIDRLLENNPSL